MILYEICRWVVVLTHHSILGAVWVAIVIQEVEALDHIIEVCLFLHAIPFSALLGEADKSFCSLGLFRF